MSEENEASRAVRLHAAGAKQWERPEAFAAAVHEAVADISMDIVAAGTLGTVGYFWKPIWKYVSGEFIGPIKKTYYTRKQVVNHLFSEVKENKQFTLVGPKDYIARHDFSTKGYPSAKEALWTISRCIASAMRTRKLLKENHVKTYTNFNQNIITAGSSLSNPTTKMLTDPLIKKDEMPFYLEEGNRNIKIKRYTFGVDYEEPYWHLNTVDGHRIEPSINANNRITIDFGIISKLINIENPAFLHVNLAGIYGSATQGTGKVLKDPEQVKKLIKYTQRSQYFQALYSFPLSTSYKGGSEYNQHPNKQLELVGICTGKRSDNSIKWDDIEWIKNPNELGG